MYKLLLIFSLLTIVLLSANSKRMDPPLFEHINDYTLRINNPQYLRIYGVLPLIERPLVAGMTDLGSSIDNDGNFISYFGVPQNSGGNSRLGWTGTSWPANATDWREGGSFDIDFPDAGVYFIESRGPTLTIESIVIDTRWYDPLPPSLFSASIVGPNKISFSWIDNSDNETLFYIVPECLVSGRWKPLALIRASADSTESMTKLAPGQYRFAIYAYLYGESLNCTIEYRVAGQNNLVIEEFDTTPVIKTSSLSEWVYLQILDTQMEKD